MFPLHRNLNEDVAQGLDFMLSILPDKSFPRNILVGQYHKPFLADDRDDVLYRFKAMGYEDCYLSAYPNYQWMKENGRLPPTYRPPANHLMIDIDRKDFRTESEFQQAITDVKANISKYIDNASKVIVESGNGVHVHLPMPGLTTSLEEIADFERFRTTTPSELDVIFLRYLERKLTNGRADKCHNPSVSSLMFRCLGTLNTRARDRGVENPYVRIVEGGPMSCSLEPDINNTSKPSDKLLNDFYLYLMSKKMESRLEEAQRAERRLWRELEPPGSPTRADSTIPWIEKVLQTGVEDQRKDLLFWVLAPYLVTVRRLDHEQAFIILDGWLAKCNEVRRLEPKASDFHRRVNYCIKYCIDRLEEQKPRWPTSLETFQEYYPDLYEEISDKAK